MLDSIAIASSGSECGRNRHRRQLVERGRRLVVEVLEVRSAPSFMAWSDLALASALTHSPNETLVNDVHVTEDASAKSRDATKLHTGTNYSEFPRQSALVRETAFAQWRHSRARATESTFAARSTSLQALSESPPLGAWHGEDLFEFESLETAANEIGVGLQQWQRQAGAYDDGGAIYLRSSVAGAAGGGSSRASASFVSQQAAPAVTAASLPVAINSQPSTSSDGSTEESTVAASISLVSPSGQPIVVPLDGNTLVVAASSTCSACKAFKSDVKSLLDSGKLEGLRLIFAYRATDAGAREAAANGTAIGEMMFLGDDSPRPTAFPKAFDPESGKFDADPRDAINGWLDEQPQAALLCDTHGDYTGDCKVDGADFLVWQRQFGMTGAGLAADGNPDLAVDGLDLEIWKQNFGVVATTPGTFEITGPGHSLTDDNFTISWTASPRAMSYELVMSSSEDLSVPFFTEELTGTFRSFTNFGDATVYVGISAKNPSGETLVANSPYLINVSLPEPTGQVVFVTSLQFNVDSEYIDPPLPQLFHGAAVADYHVTALANQAGLIAGTWDQQGYHYRAMVTIAFTHLIARTPLGSGPFRNVNGEIIAETQAQFLSGVHSAPILNEKGQLVTGSNVPVWTGADSKGEWTNLTCDEWAKPEAGSASVGNLNAGDAGFLNNGTRSCAQAARFIAIGVPQTPLGAIKWDGGAGTTNWHDAANWSGNVVPGPNDDVVLSSFNPAVTINGGHVTVKSLTASNLVNLTGGATLELLAPSAFYGQFNVSNATIAGAGTISLKGSSLWAGATLQGTGAVTVEQNATLTLTGAATHLGARQLINLGTVSWSGGNLLLNHGTIDNRSVFAVSNTTVLIREIQAVSEPSYFYNSGTIVKTGSGTNRVLPGVTFSSTGVINVQQGAFDYGGIA